MASINSIGNRVADDNFQIFNRTADTSSNSVDLIKNRSGGAITSGDQLGSVIFYGNDGSSNIIGARILAGSSGTIAANRVAGNLYFYTHPDSTSAAAIRMTINSAGAVTINPQDATGYDLSVDGSKAGLSMGILARNTSNTASSTVNLQLQVGGSSAADPLVIYTVATATSWAQGIDNSDSDAFVISQGSTLGTNNVMRVATTGEITYPLQCSFNAYLGSTDANVTGDATVFTVGSTTAMTEVFDRNSDFNTNGTFTAPVTGLYCLKGFVGMTSVAVTHTGGTLRINTTGGLYLTDSLNMGAIRTSGNAVRLGLSCFVPMTAGDTATLQFNVDSSTKTVGCEGSSNRVTVFMGWLVA